MTRVLALMLAAVIVLGFAGFNLASHKPDRPAEKSAGHLRHIPLNDELIRSGIPIIDIRRESEWSTTGVVPGSHLLTFFHEDGTYDLDAFLAGINEIIRPGEPFAIMCRTGKRSFRVASFLVKNGFAAVISVYDGINGGIANGIPLAPYTGGDVEAAPKKNDQAMSRPG